MAAKIYSVKNQQSETEVNKNDHIIPSMEYINELVSEIENVLRNHFADTDAHDVGTKFYGFDAIKTTTEALPTEEIVETETKASDIIEDANHKFITDTYMKIFKDKPSMLDMENAIDAAKSELKMAMNENYNKLINMPDALTKLKNLATILKEEDTLNEVMSLIAQNATKEELKEHAESNCHVTNNDRKALNLLLSFIAEGCADWNADESAPNYIRNKPSALPADGGNADSVGGYGIKTLMPKRIHDIYIGQSNNGYNKFQVDLFIDSDETADYVKNLLTNTDKNDVFFRKGTYEFDTVTRTEDKSITISGCNNESVLKINEVMYLFNTTLKDLTIEGGCVYIFSDNKINNVTFKDCQIIFSNADRNRFTDNNLKKCQYMYRGSCMYNIISGNMADNEIKFAYAGGGNVITHNINY